MDGYVSFEETYRNVQAVLRAVDEIGAWERSGTTSDPPIEIQRAMKMVDEFFGPSPKQDPS